MNIELPSAATTVDRSFPVTRPLTEAYLDHAGYVSDKMQQIRGLENSLFEATETLNSWQLARAAGADEIKALRSST